MLFTGGGELVLGGDIRVIIFSPPPAEVLVTSASALFVPDPFLGDRTPWEGSGCAAEHAGEAAGVEGLAVSFSPAVSSTAARGGEGAAVAGGSLAGELVVSSSIAVALQELPGLVFIIRSKKEQKGKRKKLLTQHLFENHRVCQC